MILIYSKSFTTFFEYINGLNYFMSERLLLKPTAILSVPFQIYDKDFSFFINGEEFKTTRLVSDLLSPKICRQHSNDPTFSEFTIKTNHKGNFSHILELISFDIINLPKNELPFILEVLKILGNESIEIFDCENAKKITINNVFKLVKKHEIYSKQYSKQLKEEIEFIASHFFEIIEEQEDEFLKLDINTIFEILSQEKLKLNTEDQLLKFVNSLYSKDKKYSILYEFVYFSNVTSLEMSNFISIFDLTNITNETWNKLCDRMKEEIISKKENNSINESRYKVKIQQGKLFECSEFSGIINYLYEQSNGKIENKINFTSSSVYQNQDENLSKNVASFNDENVRFASDEPNSWMTLDFKNHSVIPTNYTIKTSNSYVGKNHLKNWVIEGSNDNKNFEILDEEKDCPHLNTKNIVHTFTINNSQSKQFRFIRIRLTGQNMNNNNHLTIGSFELYGRLI